MLAYGNDPIALAVAMDTIIIEHKMGGMLDYDLIEENP